MMQQIQLNTRGPWEQHSSKMGASWIPESLLEGESPKKAIHQEHLCSTWCEVEKMRNTFFTLLIHCDFEVVTGANDNYSDLAHVFSLFYIKYMSFEISKQAIKRI